MKAITLRQPWASLVLGKYTNIINRTWSTTFRGQVLLHAGQGVDRWTWQLAEKLGTLPPHFTRHLPRGQIIGVMKIANCIDHSPSRWFLGPYGFVVEDVHPVRYFHCSGNKELWDCNYPHMQDENLEDHPPLPMNMHEDKETGQIEFF